jgi:acetyl esterase/lipase
MTYFPTHLEAILDVPYGALTDRAHLLDILRPRDSRLPTPAIVHFHGGGWQKFGKYLEDNVFLAEARFCVVSANYRYSQEAHFPAQLFDAKAAVRFVRAHAAELNVDPHRIYAWGISAGAHLAALLGTTANNEELEDEAERGMFGSVDKTGISSRVAGVAAVCAPTDLTDKVAWARTYADPEEGFQSLLGAHGDEQSELARAASPLFHVTHSAAPFLILHGALDETVPLSQATDFHGALKRAGVSSELTIVEDGDHFINETHQALMQEKVLEFFLNRSVAL